MKLESHPGVDIVGGKYYRFRLPGGGARYLPGAPSDPEFEAVYLALVEGREVKLVDRRTKAKRDTRSLTLQGLEPRTFGAAWLCVQKSEDWRKCDAKTRENQSHIAEDFLRAPINPADPKGVLWRDCPVADLKRRHIDDNILFPLFAARPHQKKTCLVVMRKMIGYAIKQEWVEADVTLRHKLPKKGKSSWLPWTNFLCAKFERTFEIGTMARTVFELAYNLGLRRSDIAASLRWELIDTVRVKLPSGEVRTVTGFLFDVYKNRNRTDKDAVFLPINQRLAKALAPIARESGPVLAKANGKPYRIDSLSMMMRRFWGPQAGIPVGYSLHGIRKVMGRRLAYAGASTKQAQAVFSHADEQTTAIYQQSALQTVMAIQGLDAVDQMGDELEVLEVFDRREVTPADMLSSVATGALPGKPVKKAA